MEEATVAKWKGKAKTEVRGQKAEEVWLMVADFCGLSKWYPTPTCIPVEGISGQPGCVRFCAGFKTHLHQNEIQRLNWTKQKLLSIDPCGMTMKYAIIDSNVGFQNYIATWRVFESGDGNGCEVEWEYEVEPVEGWTFEKLDAFINSGLQVMGQRMEADLNAMHQALITPPSN